MLDTLFSVGRRSHLGGLLSGAMCDVNDARRDCHANQEHNRDGRKQHEPQEARRNGGGQRFHFHVQASRRFAVSRSALQRRVDDGEALLTGPERDVADAEDGAQLVVVDLQGAG